MAEKFENVSLSVARIKFSICQVFDHLFFYIKKKDYDIHALAHLVQQPLLLVCKI